MSLGHPVKIQEKKITTITTTTTTTTHYLCLTNYVLYEAVFHNLIDKVN